MTHRNLHRVVTIDDLGEAIRERPMLREAKHITIYPKVPVWEVAGCLFVAAGIGAMLVSL